MNLHPRRYHHDTVERSGRKPTGNIQCCVGYQVCFGTRGVVLCKSRNVKKVQDAGGVFNTTGMENRGVGGKKGYIYLSSCNLIHILSFVGY